MDPSQGDRHTHAPANDPLAAVGNTDDGPLSVLDGYDTDSDAPSDYNPRPPSVPETMSLFVNRKPAPPQLNLDQVDPDPHVTTAGTPTSASNPNHDFKTPNTDKPLPKSPGSSKLGNFFGWGSPSSATTEFSPLPSPYTAAVTDASPTTTVGPSGKLEAPKGPGSSDSRQYCESYLATPPDIYPSHPGQIEEMEDELKAISAELASSIRREMDLEDLVDRLQAEKENPVNTGNRRTSDYFSDSGYSSARLSEYDQSKDEIERIQRRAEQEMAQVRLELTNKLQDERSKRQQLDDQIKELSQKASEIDHDQLNNADDSERVKELENTCETLRRKLAEERQVKDNFEDLVAAMKGELQNASNERDNLRDEIVPQLRARVEGLEAQSAELEQMQYASTKMQQELQNLKTENTTLREEKAIGTVAEEDAAPLAGSRLSRPVSITGPPSAFRLQRPPSSQSLSRSKSVRNSGEPSGLSRSVSVKAAEPRDFLSDRLKDVEEQRDALHRALKALLERQDCQNRENEKKIRALEMERDRLLSGSPQKAGFVREVSNLREEINTLRRRSEEALEQKWQLEKGLAGLKMDLDRAEQEISSLRMLLTEKDVLIPENYARSSSASNGSVGLQPVTSASLSSAYQELQTAYKEALDRVKDLESKAPHDERTQLAIEKLEVALSSAVSDRDLARQEASAYKAQLDDLRADERIWAESEKSLADELQESARRVEELALQVRQQLSSNQNLRQRLTETVARGEVDQKFNIERIIMLQDRLRVLEEQVVAAQTASEDRVSRHEEELTTLKESHNQQLARLSTGLRSPRLFPPKSPMSPFFASPTARSPRLSVTRSGSAMSVSEETQVATLKQRVAELEKALSEADTEMQLVVNRMATAQIEVLQLQEEREAAIKQARSLEKALEAEKVKAFEDRFKTLQG